MKFVGRRALWRTLHRWIGLTLGGLLGVIGLTGAALAFRAEILEAINPGVTRVAVRSEPRLTPSALLASLPQGLQGRSVATLTVFSDPGLAPRLILTARPQHPDENRYFYLDPYTGAVRQLAGQTVMDTVESVHRWLMLPKAAGKPVTGLLALLAIAMALTGLVVRAPRWAAPAKAWRGMYRVEWRKRGRPFWWTLHSAAGVWMLPVFLVSGLTGIYRGFDMVGSAVDRAVGASKPPRESRKPAEIGPLTGLELDAAWGVFVDQHQPWQLASLRPTRQAGHPVQITWVASQATHERQRNLMQITPGQTVPDVDERHDAQTPGERAVRWVYPLHVGTWAGVPGRLVMFAAALSMALLAATGWVLYLKRPRRA